MTDSSKNSTFISKNFIISVCLIILVSCFFVFLDFDRSTFEYDEIFTIATIKYSFQDIWRITTTDVHPPLYYIMLKAFTLLFGTTSIVFRIFSALGVIATLFLGLFPIRKYFGEKVSLLFIILIIILPVTQYLATEVRMYSWAIFFVLASALSAYRVITNGQLINYIALVFLALCAAYTHYFALIGVLFIFLILIGSIIYFKKPIRSIAIVLILFAIGYGFWIPDLMAQMSRVNINYWIEKPGLKDLLLLTYYSFSPKEPSHSYTIFDLPTMSVALSMMLLLLTILLGYTIKRYKTLDQNKLITACIFIAAGILPILAAVVYSYIIKPIIIPRYITCYLGCIIVGLSILIPKIYKSGKFGKAILISSLCMLTLLSIARIFSEKKYNQLQEQHWDELKSFFNDKISGNTTFLSPIYSSIELAKLEFLYPDNLFLFYSSQKTNYTTEPFGYKEVNTLPKDFDFYLVLRNSSFPIHIKDNADFVNGTKNNYTISDSLIQSDKKIYRMRTIHREREKN